MFYIFPRRKLVLQCSYHEESNRVYNGESRRAFRVVASRRSIKKFVLHSKYKARKINEVRLVRIRNAMTQLAPLWRASMQFAREQQRISSPSSIVNPSYLHTYAPDRPIESYRSQVDRIAEPSLRLIAGKIRVLPTKTSDVLVRSVRLLREGKIADDVSSNSFCAVDGRRKGWRRIIPRNYLSKYILPEELFPIQIRSNGNRIISIVSFVTKRILRRVGGSSSCRDTV